MASQLSTPCEVARLRCQDGPAANSSSGPSQVKPRGQCGLHEPIPGRKCWPSSTMMPLTARDWFMKPTLPSWLTPDLAGVFQYIHILVQQDMVGYSGI